MSKTAHIIGIGGIGMSAIARLLLGSGWRVTGSDQKSSTITKQLEALGATCYVGHRAKQVSADATVIFSTAVKQDNPEMEAPAARRLHRSEMLQELMQGQRVLAVAGTHGKTTTSAMLTWVLQQLGAEPSYALGGLLNGSNAGFGRGPWFVVEADESDGSFLRMKPEVAIVTNLEPEHMDFWKEEAKLIDAFREFIDNTGKLYWCDEDPRLREICKGETPYGLGDVEMGVMGRHNRLNGEAVYRVVTDLGFDEQEVRAALLSFPGVARRMERRATENGPLIFDDYAHHPTEIAATMEGVRARYPERRVVAVVQPHRFSRTRDCLDLWRGAADTADSVIVTDVFAAGEQPNGITGVTVAQEMNGLYIARGLLVDGLKDLLGVGDVVVFMGAGDITAVSREVASLYQGAPA